MRIFQFCNSDTSPEASQASSRPLKAEGDGESVLEDWLNTSPEALLDEPILLFSRQPHLPTGEADLLGLDRFGNVVVFELKRGDSGSESASEKSIISQPQLYAQSLSRYDYHELAALTEEYQDGYSVPDVLETSSSLIEAFNSFFGKDTSRWDLNSSQRLVIVAEDITSQTRESARWLRDSGLDIQCVEVQRFGFPSGEVGFGATTIVDYDETRTQTDSTSKPGDRVFATNVFTTAFLEIQDLLSVDSIDPVVGNMSTNYPYLETRADGHPESVRYALRVNPYQDNEVKVAIDSFGDGREYADRLRDHEELLESHGFTVNSNKSMRIVVDVWEEIDVKHLRREEFIQQVALRYVELVELGHEILT